MKVKSKKKSRTRLLHQYYSYTGFYAFLGKSLKKSAIPIILIVGLLFFVNEYVFTIDDGLELLTNSFSRIGVLITFFISETFKSSRSYHYTQFCIWCYCFNWSLVQCIFND